jgi:hypothetical protein
MGNYFTVAIIKGKPSSTSLENLEVAARMVVNSMGVNHFGSLVEKFSFGEEILLEVSKGYPLDIPDYTIAPGWIERVREVIYERLLDSAIEIYLRNRDDISCVAIAGEHLIVTGGMVSWEGETPTSAYDHIKFISWSGLDIALVAGGNSEAGS